MHRQEEAPTPICTRLRTSTASVGLQLYIYLPGTAVDVSEVISRMSNLEGEGSRWDDYDVALEAFNDMIEEQKGELKVLLEDEVMALNEGIDKFGSRWKQLKPGE